MKRSTIPSPCTGVCKLNEKDECIACGRTCFEIGEWGVMNDEERMAVLERIIGKRANPDQK